ncbi:PqqD family peptide modification chaperone [Sphingomonas sp. ST-64]|uniref:PqqD family peptide modification chaperone n=1 Tax=Sphingomonas plantiphila TaxID=3163295 RepID=A0ABW8YI65_9SPHN
MTAFTDDMVIERDSEVLFTELDGSVVMMDLDTGDYYELDAIGAVIWRRIASPVRFGTLCTELVAEYAVDDRQCREQVGAFLQKIIDNKFAHLRSASAAAPVSPE